MEDLFKKVIYTGVGLVAFAAEKIQQTADELVNQDKINEDDGKKIVDDFLNNTEAKKEEFEDKIRTFSDEFEGKIRDLSEDLSNAFTAATGSENDKTIDALVARIESLEKELGLSPIAEEVVVEAEA